MSGTRNGIHGVGLVRALTILVAAGAYIATVFVAVKASGNEHMPVNIEFYFIVLALATLTITLALLRRMVWRLFPGAFPTRSGVRRRRPHWVVDPWLALAVIVGTSLMIAAANNGGYNNRRCVNSKTMTVVALSYCGRSDMISGARGTMFMGIYKWYYGGTGLQVGDIVHGGSIVGIGTDYGETGGRGNGSTPPVSHTAK
jgi:hypothetical protein